MPSQMFSKALNTFGWKRAFQLQWSGDVSVCLLPLCCDKVHPPFPLSTLIHTEKFSLRPHLSRAVVPPSVFHQGNDCRNTGRGGWGSMRPLFPPLCDWYKRRPPLRLRLPLNVYQDYPRLPLKESSLSFFTLHSPPPSPTSFPKLFSSCFSVCFYTREKKSQGSLKTLSKAHKCPTGITWAKCIELGIYLAGLILCNVRKSEIAWRTQACEGQQAHRVSGSWARPLFFP